MKLEALTRKITKDEIKKYMGRQPVRRTFFNPSRDIISSLILLLCIVIFTVPLLSVNMTVAIVFLAAILVCAAIIIYIYFHYHQALAVKNAETGLRVEQLAHDNGWQYIHQTQNAQPRTALFSYGHDHEFVNVVSGPGFEVGQMQFMTGSGRNEKKLTYGYMVIPLKRDLPHILLDGKSNNLKVFGAEISNISTFFEKNQIDILEGDFNKYYNLYAPEGYGADVRYIFTPDLMNTLIEESDGIDIEVMDNNVYVYFGEHDLKTPAFWRKAERLNMVFRDKVSSKSMRYEDDNTDDGHVAPEATRLKKRIPLFIVVFVVFVIVFKLGELILSVIDVG